MANEEHLAILKQGVEVWNAWRKENHHIRRPDLSLADLSEVNQDKSYPLMANLREVNLHGANLYGANLHGAKLDYVDLREANLGHADLSEADLSGDDLMRANLIGLPSGTSLGGTDLSDANLTGANLYMVGLERANLYRTNLTRTDLTEAMCTATQFCDLDLSQAIGLETIKHYGPSTIGIDTLYKSKGNIPEAFLRGCGIPEDFITFISSPTWAALSSSIHVSSATATWTNHSPVAFMPLCKVAAFGVD